MRSDMRLKTAMIVPCLILGLAASSAAQLAIKGDVIWTMAGPKIENGVVLVNRDGKIERIGSASTIEIPADYRQLTAKVVTPGLIDAHSVVGLAGQFNQKHDQDQLDRSAAIQPELRAIDAYDCPREPLIDWMRGPLA